MRRFLSLFLIIVLAISVFAGCKKYDDVEPTDEELIRERIELFLSSYNNGDMETVLSCLNAKTRNTFQAMLNLLGGLAGGAAGFDINLSDLFSLGVGISSDDFMNLEITDINVIDSNNAIATTKMKLVGSGTNTIYFIMVYENDGWYISDMTDRKGGVNNTNNSNSAINVTELNSSSSCVFSMDNKEYCGVINSDGEIFYYVEGDYISWTSVGNGVGYVCYTKNGETIYDIVNQDGTIVASLKEKTDFDEIIGYGDGAILFYKDTSDIKKVEHSYRVFDCYNGTWLSSWTANTQRIYVEGFAYEPLQHIGNGVFLDVYYSGNTYNCIIYNNNIKQIIEMNDIPGLIVGIDGEIYGQGEASWYYAHVYRNGEYVDDYSLPSYFFMDINGQIESTKPFVAINKKIMISKDYYKEYYLINNLKTKTFVVYDDFKIESIVEVEIVDNHVLFTIQGADGKYYFVLVDISGNACFEPIAVEYYMGWSDSSASVTVSGNEIIYLAHGKKNYSMIDTHGNVIISEKQGYTSMEFIDDNGLILAENADGESCLLNRKGEPVTISLIEN